MITIIEFVIKHSPRGPLSNVGFSKLASNIPVLPLSAKLYQYAHDSRVPGTLH